MENQNDDRIKHARRSELIRKTVAVLMFLVGLLCLLYPVIAKRYNEHLALKANAQYAQHSAGYDENGEIVLIP